MPAVMPSHSTTWEDAAMVQNVYKWKVAYRVPVIDDPIVEAIVRVMRSGSLFRGPDTEGFEQELAAYVGVKYGAAVNSGTSALALILESLDYPAGSEIVTQSNGYISEVSTVVQAGLKPVFVEPDEETYTLDAGRVSAAFTSNTRAVFAIHMYGHPVEMGPLVDVCQRRGVDVIEVLAHATGAEYTNKRVGSFGRAAMSTFGSKMVTVNGLGGMALTNDATIASHVKTLRKNVPDAGEDYYDMERLPHNYQLSELLAAMGRVNLARLDAQIERRRQNARRLGARLSEAGLPIRLPAERKWARHSFLHFVIRTPRRAELKSFLEQRGIETRIHYEVPVYLVGPIRRAYGYKRGDFPLADQICREILSLPVGPWFEDAQVDYVAEQVIEFFKT